MIMFVLKLKVNFTGTHETEKRILVTSKPRTVRIFAGNMSIQLKKWLQ